MSIEIQKGEGNEERRILTGMIVDKRVLAKIVAKWNRKGLFSSRWSNLVGHWCVQYFRKYAKAPLSHIESLYESWAQESQDKETIRLIEKFLSGLSEEYESLSEESNSDYIIDLAGEYFNRVQIQSLMETIEGDLERGKANEAVEKIIGYQKVELGIGVGIDGLSDKKAIKDAFTSKGEPLILYPGGLGEFFGNELDRESFVAFLGPEKRGKSFWLLDVAFRAMGQRRKVAYFEAGDNSQNQVLRRLMSRISQRPIYPKKIDYPIKIKWDEEESPRVYTKQKTYKGILSWRKAVAKCDEFARQKIRSKKSYFKLSCHPNSTLSISNIESILLDWSRDDWIPDVIIIDYADIMDMTYHGIEGRDRINETWKKLRSLSQKLHCLIVTATQADARSYGVHTLQIDNFSDDKRKAAHVTGMIGINQTADEKESETMRLNWVVRREEKFSSKRCVAVASCLDIANPAVRSIF
jgi:hypothetical protein